MKIIIPMLDTPFVIYDDRINQIVFEGPSDMYSFVFELYQQLNKMDGNIVISEDEKVLDVSKVVDLTTNYFPFDINRKSIITKLQSRLRDIAIKEMYFETNELLSSVSGFIATLSDSVDGDIEYDDLDISTLLKVSNIRFCVESESLEEQIIDYCKNVIMILGDRLFVFVSLRNYLSGLAYERFKKMIIDNKIKVLLIESFERTRSDWENTIIIDEDMCVI